MSMQPKEWWLWLGKTRPERAANGSYSLHCGRLLEIVERELRRGNQYDAIIMDPPSYLYGKKGGSGSPKPTYGVCCKSVASY